MSVNVDTVRDDIDTLHLNGSANGSRHSGLSYPDRKASSPMMPAFMVSAPGKVIVFGEHAVVHGKVCRSFTYLHSIALFANC
jgi:mevalonate kinase